MSCILFDCFETVGECYPIRCHYRKLTSFRKIFDYFFAAKFRQVAVLVMNIQSCLYEFLHQPV